jgi:hypothetical protein
MVELVIFVVDLAIEVLHADIDLALFGMSNHLFESFDAVADTFFVGLPFAFAGKADDVTEARVGGEVDVASHLGDEFLVMLWAVEAARNTARTGSHGADQPVLANGGPVVGPDEVDGLVPDSRRLPAEIIEGHEAVVAPLGDGLPQSAGGLRSGWVALCVRGQHRRPEPGRCVSQHRPPGNSMSVHHRRHSLSMFARSPDTG